MVKPFGWWLLLVTDAQEIFYRSRNQHRQSHLGGRIGGLWEVFPKPALGLIRRAVRTYDLLTLEFRPPYLLSVGVQGVAPLKVHLKS